MNSTDIFRIALGLSSPWYVERVEFLDSTSEKGKELHLHLNFERGYKFSDSSGLSTTAYDTVDRVWQHLNFFQHRCYLHARVPRIKSGHGAEGTLRGGGTAHPGGDPLLPRPTS